MPASKFFEWMHLERIDPFGERRADIRAGIIASVIANCFRGKDRDPYTARDFMIPWDVAVETVKVKQQSPEEQLSMMLMIQAAQNARVAQAAANNG